MQRQVPTGIFFHAESGNRFIGEILRSPKTYAWLKSVINKENAELGTIHYYLVDDEAMLRINREYLEHDDYTDIITFPYSYQPVEADIFISGDRITENARIHGVSVEHEVLRVLVHGILHMCDYNDKSPEERELMRKRETHYIDAFYEGKE